jgi:hypothetical protein
MMASYITARPRKKYGYGGKISVYRERKEKKEEGKKKRKKKKKGKKKGIYLNV